MATTPSLTLLTTFPIADTASPSPVADKYKPILKVAFESVAKSGIDTSMVASGREETSVASKLASLVAKSALSVKDEDDNVLEVKQSRLATPPKRLIRFSVSSVSGGSRSSSSNPSVRSATPARMSLGKKPKIGNLGIAGGNHAVGHQHECDRVRKENESLISSGGRVSFFPGGEFTEPNNAIIFLLCTKSFTGRAESESSAVHFVKSTAGTTPGRSRRGQSGRRAKVSSSIGSSSSSSSSKTLVSLHSLSRKVKGQKIRNATIGARPNSAPLQLSSRRAPKIGSRNYGGWNRSKVYEIGSDSAAVEGTGSVDRGRRGENMVGKIGSESFTCHFKL